MKILKNIIMLSALIGILFFTDKHAIAPSMEKNKSLSVAEESSKTTVLAVGDVLLSRHIGTAIDKASNIYLPFEKTRDILAGADITFGNLECPLSDSNIPIREGLVFRCLTKYVPGLLDAGFDVMATTNNHSFDQGLSQIGFTADYLKSKNILPAGTGNSFEEAHEAQVISRNDILFGFLAYSYSAHNDGGKTVHPQIATMNIEQLKRDVIAARGHTADVIIVSMHAGTEYTRHPNQEQINFAHAAIDAGADVVIGHHPHWMQDIEIYPPLSPSPDEGRVAEGQERSKDQHRGIIFYSLGNFVFDQSWSQDTREGLAVELTYEGADLKQAKLIPVVIENNCCPRIATEQEKQTILQKIGRESDIIEF